MTRGLNQQVEGLNDKATELGLNEVLSSGSRTEDEGLYPIQHGYWEKVMEKAVELEDAEKNKFVAALLALFFGTFGVHKFYLGFNKAGLIMLACTLLGWVVFFLPTMIVGVIAFIEAIIYMTRSDEQFHETYEVRRKEWF